MLVTKPAHEFVAENPVGGRAGDGADRVHRHVAPQLVPDVALNLLGHRRVEARCHERGGQRLDALARLPRRLADNQPIALMMPDHARRFDQTACMHHAAHRLRAVGIAAAIAPSGSIDFSRLPAKSRPSPSQNHHGTPFIAVSTMVCGLEQRRDLRGHRRHRRSLDRHHDEVLHAEIGRLVARLDLHRLRDIAFDQPQARHVATRRASRLSPRRPRS